MTRRRSIIAKRSAAGPLDVNVEMAAAGYLHGFWHDNGMETRGYWQSIALAHGERITAKVREATPGCRPGFAYAIGTYPQIPLLADPPPPEHKAAQEFIDIDGVRFWYCWHFSHCWLPSQADYLRSIGEVDGAEWRRYLAWKRSRYAGEYVLDGAQHMTVGLMHMCY
jgi:hypothetical protein